MTPIVLVTGGAAALYALLCWARPFARCPHCRGTGTRQTFITRRYQPCRHCWNSGLRLRLGRRIVNHLVVIQRDGWKAGR